MRIDGIEPDLPPNPAPEIVDWLMDAGPVMLTGADRIPLTWTEIDNWSRGNLIRLTPWERRQIKRLSGAFLAASRDGEDPEAQAPWAPKELDRASVEKKVRSLFAMHKLMAGAGTGD